MIAAPDPGDGGEVDGTIVDAPDPVAGSGGEAAAGDALGGIGGWVDADRGANVVVVVVGARIVVGVEIGAQLLPFTV